jgi:hypothetical protein
VHLRDRLPLSPRHQLRGGRHDHRDHLGRRIRRIQQRGLPRAEHDLRGGKAAVTIATGVPGADTATTDGTNVFFGTRGNSTTPAALYACPIAGCSPVANPTPYVPNQGSVGRVVLDGNNVIWTADATGGGLLECPKTGGCTTPTVVVPNAFTNALAARNGFIYYVSGGTLYVVAE